LTIKDNPGHRCHIFRSPAPWHINCSFHWPKKTENDKGGTHMATGYHEAELSNQAKDFHRAITSLIEELEAIDWYNQRIDVTGDQQLAAILTHNRNEEVEHAAMALEWLRRTLPVFDEELRTYLFTSGPIHELEEAEGEQGGEEGGGTGASHGSLNIGDMKGGE
jgi:hypothetical protein